MQAQFSLIVAIYNVEEYIDAFLESLERQTYGLDCLDVVLVDDGATDGSGEMARVWAERHPDSVTFLRQENAGQGAARNAGLEVARGEWVTFCDPDDVLAPTYFAEIAAFLAQHQEPAPLMLATRILTFTDDHTVTYNRHPLRKNFAGGNQLVDVSRFPDRIHLSGGTSFFLRERLGSMRFDTRIRPTFEDGHFVAHYLLDCDVPLVGFISTAEYYYRKRADSSSAVQSGWAQTDKYTTVLRLGYLDVLSHAAEQNGSVPLWLQNTILYDLAWYFRADAQITSFTGSLSTVVLSEFHELLEQIFKYIDEETILGFRIIRLDWWQKRSIIGGYKREIRNPEAVYLDRIDKPQRLVRARYLFTGNLPVEEFRLRGLPVKPAHAKVRAVQAFGRTLVNERIVWLPTEGTLRVSLAGRPVALVTRAPEDPPYALSADQLWRSLGIARPLQSPVARRSLAARAGSRVQRRVYGLAKRVTPQKTWDEREAEATKLYARVPVVRHRYRNAWVLMDRLDQGQDNAEHLYRYLIQHQPKVNAFFVLQKDSPDWARLKSDGFRLVAHGSREWRALLLNAKHVVSSQANAFATSPLPRKLYGTPSWTFTFLQHGVTKDDLSRWLNPKRIHLISTATSSEYQSLVGDGTPYTFSSKEVKLVGFARHDELLRLAADTPSSRTDRLLVMPTWRRALTDALDPSLSEPERRRVFLDSDFARQWFGMLADRRLHAAAASQGLRIALMPHPNMAPLLDPSDLPEGVELLRWADVNIQEQIARSRVLLTDYTSVAFDMALLGRPTVYYQFDQATFFSGAQPFRRGYFDYATDGFGPVTEDHDECIEEIEKLAAGGFETPDRYARRIRDAFGEPDGQACARTYRAIKGLLRPQRAQVISPEASPTAPGTI